jgi:hypothetical protein
VLVVRALPASGGASYAALGDDFDHALKRLLRRSGSQEGRVDEHDGISEQGVTS